MPKLNKTNFGGLTTQGRSMLMSKIRSKNTKPELLLRRELYARGLRYRIHSKKLPGKPDVSVEKYKLIVEVRGCFWHGHTNCKNGHFPKGNNQYWTNKIRSNRERDLKNLAKLESLGYKTFEVWECETKNKALLSCNVSAIFDYLVRAQNFKIPT